MGDNISENESTWPIKLLKVLYFLLILYLFFFCIELMGSSFKLFGKSAAEGLMRVTDNPIAGLLIGLLATSLMQSSSSTTSIIVTMVATGTLTIDNAIPMVMGANIGTTITATIVSLGHISRPSEFERAYSGATVHDFFNLCSVALFLPIEILFHPIGRAAGLLEHALGGMQGAEFDSPLKMIVKPLVHLVIEMGKGLISNNVALAVILLVLALAILVFSLSRMVKIMRGAMADRLEVVVDRFLFSGTIRAIVIGAVVTAIVQSSSVTTSIVIPLLGAGIVRLEAVFPYMVGANIGTTITAIMASLVTGSHEAVVIALCHFLFNVFGTIVWIPLKVVPITLAKKLGKATAKRKWVALLFILIVFFAIPGIILLLFEI